MNAFIGVDLEVEQTFEVSVVDVFFDAGANNIGVFFQQVGVGAAQFGSYLVTHVDQLAEVGVVVGVSGDVAQGVGVFFGRPAFDFFDGRQLGLVDFNDVGIGSAKFVHAAQGVDVNGFGYFEGFTAGNGQTDDFFQPGGTCSFQVQTFVVLLDNLGHNGVT